MLIASVALVAALVLVPTAGAATVTVTLGGTTVDVDGDPSRNDLDIDYAVDDNGTPQPDDDVGFVSVRDDGGNVPNAGAGCAKINQTDLIVYCQDVGGAIAKYDVGLGAGDDTLAIKAFFTTGVARGEAGNDRMTGAAGGNATYPGNDTFDGGDGNDEFFPAIGDDTFNGGPGNDIANGSTGKDLLNGGADADQLQGQEDEDKLFGGDGDDRVLGNEGNDQVSGENGNDDVQGNAGDDLVSGGEGDDRLEYHFVFTSNGQGAGRDDLSGGNGKDQVSYEDHSGGVTITVDDQANDGTSGEGDNVRGDIEIVTGSNGRDTITGNANANELNGSSEDDLLEGGGGDDLINGGSGKDRVNGGDGADKLEGSSDEDVLDGGKGRDTFEGDPPCTLNGCSGGSDDILARDGEEDRVNCGVGADKVTADQFDIVATDPQQGCETVDRATIGNPNPPTNPTGPTGPTLDPAASVQFKLLSKRSFRALLRSGARFSVSCAGACEAVGTLFYKGTKVATGRKTALKAGTVTVVVKVSKAGKRKLKRLKKGSLVLKVTVTNPSGNRTLFTRTLAFTR